MEAVTKFAKEYLVLHDMTRHDYRDQKKKDKNMGWDWRKVTSNATDTNRSSSHDMYMLARVAQGSDHYVMPRNNTASPNVSTLIPLVCGAVTAPAHHLGLSAPAKLLWHRCFCGFISASEDNTSCY
jgi:hypothetical protein